MMLILQVFTFSLLLLSGVYCCNDGDIRFNTDFNATVNIVQVCAAGKWSFICGNNWYKAEATVVCQQMGFKAADTYRHSGFSQILSQSDQYISYINCAGIEGHLLDCSHSGIILQTNDTCKKNGLYVYATLTCIQEEDTTNCLNGDIRHRNKTLERCINGKWDHIYLTNVESWTEKHASVACRQLGLNPKGANSSNDLLADDDGPSIKFQYHCFGYEESLNGCAVSSSSLPATAVAGITCGDIPSPPLEVTIKQIYPSSAILMWKHNNSLQFNIHCKHHVYHSISLSVNNSNSTTIKGFLPSREYRCCISAQSLQGESTEVCKMFITGSTAEAATEMPKTWPEHINTSSIISTSTQVTPSHTLLSSNMPIQSIDSVASGNNGITSWIGGVTIGLASGIVITIVIAVVAVSVLIKRRIPADGSSTAYKVNTAASRPIVLRRSNDPSNNPVYMFSGVEPEYNYPSLNVNNNNGGEPHSTATYEQPQPSDINFQIIYQNLVNIGEQVENDENDADNIIASL